AQAFVAGCRRAAGRPPLTSPSSRPAHAPQHPFAHSLCAQMRPHALSRTGCANRGSRRAVRLRFSFRDESPLGPKEFRSLEAWYVAVSTTERGAMAVAATII